MLRSYLKITYRNLVRNKLTTLINIIGLSIGIASCLIILQYTNFELSFERDFENYERIYRVTTISLENAQEQEYSALSSPKLARAYNLDFPEVQSFTQLLPTHNWFDCTLQYNSGNKIQIFNEPNLCFADSSFLKFFSIHLKEGDQQSALKYPNSIVLSESAAKRYFGSHDAIGKVLRLKGSMQDNAYTVTGIMVDMPKNSHLLNVNILASLSSTEGNQNLTDSDLYNFVLLKGKKSTSDFENRLNSSHSKYQINTGPVGTRTSYQLIALKDIYLYSNLLDEMHVNGNSELIYYLQIVAIFIVVIAWINYINLTTARSLERNKEIAIRKVSGATNKELIPQFLIESFTINLISILCAVCFVKVCSSSIYSLVGVNYYQDLFGLDLGAVLYLCLSLFIGIILSGIYPAIMFSLISPITALKGRLIVNRSGVTIRKGLVIFQFGVSIALVIAVFTFNTQFKFMGNQDLKIQIANTIVIKAPPNVDSTYLTKLNTFRKYLGGVAAISSVTTSSSVPGDLIDWQGSVRKESDKSLAEENFSVQVIDDNFIESYQLKMLAGRNFEPSEFATQNFGRNIESVIINNLGARRLRFSVPEDAIGKIVLWGSIKCRIIGIVNDFHQRSLRMPIEPMLFTVNYGPYISIKLNERTYENNLANGLAIIRNVWNHFFPDNPFDFYLLEDHFLAQYEKDKQFSSFFNILCGLALLVSCMGLFGLSIYSTKQRIKEVGIRKALGASIAQVVIMLCREFMILILLASLISMPITYLCINPWLSNYAYHIDLNLWLFTIPVILITILALATISFQTISVAKTDPVKTMRHE